MVALSPASCNELLCLCGYTGQGLVSLLLRSLFEATLDSFVDGAGSQTCCLQLACYNLGQGLLPAWLTERLQVVARAGHQTHYLQLLCLPQFKQPFLVEKAEVGTGKADSWWNTIFVFLVHRARSGRAAAH